MNSESIDPRSAFPKDDSATCDRCGRFGALEVNDLHLCEDCFALSGSCCPEFEEEAAAETAPAEKDTSLGPGGTGDSSVPSGHWPDGTEGG